MSDSTPEARETGLSAQILWVQPNIAESKLTQIASASGCPVKGVNTLSQAISEWQTSSYTILAVPHNFNDEIHGDRVLEAILQTSAPKPILVAVVITDSLSSDELQHYQQGHWPVIGFSETATPSRIGSQFQDALNRLREDQQSPPPASLHTFN